MNGGCVSSAWPIVAPSAGRLNTPAWTIPKQHVSAKGRPVQGGESGTARGGLVVQMELRRRDVIRPRHITGASRPARGGGEPLRAALFEAGRGQLCPATLQLVGYLFADCCIAVGGGVTLYMLNLILPSRVRVPV